MGLKGYRLWVMGQLDSTCRAPPHGAPTTPRETNPGGGTGRQRASPTAAAAASERGASIRSKDTGGAVKAGESRITSTGSEGGFSVPAV
jgi:hypothetical protein